MNVKQVIVSALLAGTTLGYAPLAAAQEQPQAATDAPAEEYSATDIVVTAQRRSERLQDIPATISALDSQALRAAGVLDISNIAPRVPGFYAGGFGASRPQLYIRGIGTRQFDPGSESSVGVFVDESYLGRTGGVLGVLKDIERVEVLKGPQGTLYGRNTIGGAVNVITKAPTSDFHVEGEAGIGNYDSYELFAAVSGPIAGDAIKARLAGWRSYREGYITNLTTGNKAQGLDNYGGRARLELNPTENLKIDLIGELVRDEGPSFQGVSQGTVANPNSILLDRSDVTPPIRSADPFAQYYTSDPAYDRHIDAFTGKAALDLGVGTFVSVTSYRKLKYTDDRDFDNTNLDVIRQISDETSKQFSQELRFVSEPEGALSLGGRIDWILGVYYYKDTSFHQDTFQFGVDSVPAQASLDGMTPQVDTTNGNYRTESIAAFGQAAIHVTDTVDLTLGGRWTQDLKQATLRGTTTDAQPLVTAAFVQVNPSVKFRSFDPRVVLSWQPTRDLNFYASWSRGFKSGGYQYTPLSAAQAALVFRPEKLDAFEAGIKSVWLDGAARINAAVYHYNYRDLQVSTVVDLGGGNTPSLISNAASSKVDGAELDVTLEPTKGLTFNLGYAYTNAKYSKYVGPAGVDYSNTVLVRAPKHSVNVSGQYTFPIGEDTDVTLRGDYALLSDFYHEPRP
ncbi:MAG: TonB-dependent receptor, partial [Pseudomonadota bacterium]